MSSLRARLPSLWWSPTHPCTTWPLPPPLTLAPSHPPTLQWLFFLHMGSTAPVLRHLARMSYLAQQVLLLPLAGSPKASLGVSVWEGVRRGGVGWGGLTHKRGALGGSKHTLYMMHGDTWQDLQQPLELRPKAVRQCAPFPAWVLCMGGTPVRPQPTFQHPPPPHKTQSHTFDPAPCGPGPCLCT